MKNARNRAPKSQPLIRVKTTQEDLDRYQALARRYGYAQISPFLRRLLDAADRAKEPGVIRFMDGCESVVP